jgi:hypothetical protein
MTKKGYKIWDADNWGSVKRVDTRLEQLIHQATNMQGRFRLFTYNITSPIPPYLASQQENYSMVKTVERHRFSKEIAEELLAVHGAFAHLYVLEEIESNQSKLDTKPMWRDVLTWLDELGGDDARGSERGDKPRPRDEREGD